MTGEITLRELAGLDVEILKGVGENRQRARIAHHLSTAMGGPHC
jgi:hypothetical protein